MKDNVKFFSTLCFAVMGVALGCWLMAMSIKEQLFAHLSKSWPTVRGTVLSSDVRVVNGRWTSYYPDVRYQYVVNNVSFVGRRISYGKFDEGYSYDEAMDIATIYRHAQFVEVRYDPAFPANACLKLGKVGSLRTSIMLVLASCLVGVSIVSAKDAYHRFNMEHRYALK